MTNGRSRRTAWAGVLMVGATLTMMAKSAAAPIGDTDVWWNLRLGRELSHQAWWGTPPRLSSFATAAWAPTEPLPDVVGTKVEQWFGLPGLAWLYGLALVTVLLATYGALRRVASTIPAALTTLLAMLASTQSLTPRPQLTSLCLLPIVIVAWFRSAEDHRVRWWLIPVFWLWSCCHGFWFIGALLGLLVALTILVTGRATTAIRARLAGVATASVGVVLLNPVGPRVFLAPFVVRDRSSYIIEWHRTDLFSPAALVTLLMIAGAAVVVVRSGQRDPVRIVLLGVALFFTWYSSRTVSIGGVLAAVVLADGLELLVSTDPAEAPGHGRGEAAALVGWAAVCLVVLAFVVPHTSERPAGVPEAFNARLDALSAGTVVFNNYETGGWLAWRHPDLDHYIDPLADAYPVSHLQRYVVALNARPGWLSIVRSSGALVALVQEGAPLSAALEQRGWIVEDRDRGYVLLASASQ